MVKGFCKKCNKEIGGFLKPTAWRCSTCRRIYCKECCPQIGFIFKTPVCPKCGVELKAQ